MADIHSKITESRLQVLLKAKDGVSFICSDPTLDREFWWTKGPTQQYGAVFDEKIQRPVFADALGSAFISGASGAPYDGIMDGIIYDTKTFSSDSVTIGISEYPAWQAFLKKNTQSDILIHTYKLDARFNPVSKSTVATTTYAGTYSARRLLGTKDLVEKSFVGKCDTWFFYHESRIQSKTWPAARKAKYLELLKPCIVLSSDGKSNMQIDKTPTGFTF